jgi:heptaprenyl diphosphate synthase
MWAPSKNEFLQAINELIEECLEPISDDMGKLGERLLNLSCRHLCVSSHAKRARPLLCLYYHWMFCEKLPREFIRIGVAAEFIHAASLLHDDIIDEADLRRGKSSTNHLYGNATAVLAGDYLLTQAFDLLRPFDRVLVDQAILVVREMAKAASLEFSLRGNLNTSIEDLQTIAKGKTGILFSWCGFAAAVCSNNFLYADKLWQVGERIGIIFQMADDLKDFDGDKNLKDICRDILNLEPSIPIMLAIEQEFAIKQKFANAINSQKVDFKLMKELRKLVVKSGALKKTRSLMLEELEHVMSSLSIFCGTKGKTCIDHWISSLLIT